MASVASYTLKMRQSPVFGRDHWSSRIMNRQDFNTVKFSKLKLVVQMTMSEVPDHTDEDA